VRILGIVMSVFALISLGYGAGEVMAQRGQQRAHVQLDGTYAEVILLSPDGYCPSCRRLRERLKGAMAGELGDLILRGSVRVREVSWGDGAVQLMERHHLPEGGLLLLGPGGKGIPLRDPYGHLDSQGDFDRYLMGHLSRLLGGVNR